VRELLLKVVLYCPEVVVAQFVPQLSLGHHLSVAVSLYAGVMGLRDLYLIHQPEFHLHSASLELRDGSNVT
jgi:hypothetical protein